MSRKPLFPLFAVSLLTLGLAGCSSASPSKPAPATNASRSSIVLVPQVMAAAGLQGVIGSPASALTRRFGSPRINLTEGDAHKLQFVGQTCVLDIYLYPLNAGAEPTATHVDARVRQGGAPIDPGACIREVERR
jgi:hypothetical protein